MADCGAGLLMDTSTLSIIYKNPLNGCSPTNSRMISSARYYAARIAILLYPFMSDSVESGLIKLTDPHGHFHEAVSLQASFISKIPQDNKKFKGIPTQLTSYGTLIRAEALDSIQKSLHSST